MATGEDKQTAEIHVEILMHTHITSKNPQNSMESLSIADYCTSINRQNNLALFNQVPKMR